MGNFHGYVSLPEGICPYIFIRIIHMNTLPETNGLPLKNPGLEDEFRLDVFRPIFRGKLSGGVVGTT